MRGSGRLRLLLVLLVLTAFTLTALDYRSTGDSSAFDAVRRGSATVFGPAQRALGGAAHSVAVGSGKCIEEFESLKKVLVASETH